MVVIVVCCDTEASSARIGELGEARMNRSCAAGVKLRSRLSIAPESSKSLMRRMRK